MEPKNCLNCGHRVKKEHYSDTCLLTGTSIELAREMNFAFEKPPCDLNFSGWVPERRVTPKEPAPKEPTSVVIKFPRKRLSWWESVLRGFKKIRLF